MGKTIYYTDSNKTGISPEMIQKGVLKPKFLNINKIRMLMFMFIIGIILTTSSGKAFAFFESELMPENSGHQTSTYLNQISIDEDEGNGAFRDALLGGNLILNIRTRGEFVSHWELSGAQAITSKLQFGYNTGSYYGFSALVDFVNVNAFTPTRFNAAGLNNQPDRAIVADPELTVLNQLYSQFHLEKTETTIRAGRQRIIHDDARFIGNVGWRQNEQTYDAISVQSSLGLDEFNFQYSYLWQVNRIFGPQHDMGVLDADSHLASASYSGLPFGRLSGFFYLFDFSNAPGLSLNTLGGQLDGTLPIYSREGSRKFSWNYKFTYAAQNTSADHPADYTVNYYRLSSGILAESLADIGFGYEVFGSDDGEAAFQTTLATLHAYQGWADMFLTIPPEGIKDFHVTGTVFLPYDFNLTGRYHWYHSNTGGQEFGRELNVSLSKQLHENVGILFKYADFRGEADFENIRKTWIQLQFDF